MRRTGVVVSALLTMSLLSGCSASVDGWVGVTVDEQGEVVILVQACNLSFEWLEVNGVEIGVLEASEEPTYADGSRWVADPTVEAGTFTQVSAISSSAPWSLETAPATFEDGFSYSVHAGLDSWGRAHRSWGANFTPEDLAQLRPGQVLPPFGDVMSLEQFQSTACS